MTQQRGLKRGAPEREHILKRVMEQVGEWEEVWVSLTAAIKDVTEPGDEWMRKESKGMARVVLERADVLREPGVELPPRHEELLQLLRLSEEYSRETAQNAGDSLAKIEEIKAALARGRDEEGIDYRDLLMRVIAAVRSDAEDPMETIAVVSVAKREMSKIEEVLRAAGLGVDDI